MGIDSSSYLGSEPEMAAPVAVQGAEHTFPLNHFFQPRHHRQGRFFFHQLRVIDLAAGIIQNHNQVIPALVLEPAMPAAIDVQQHAGQRPPRPPLTMHPAFSSARYQSRSLQGLFHPAVAELDLMVGHQLLVKMPHVQIVIPLAIESQHLLHHPQRDSLRRRPTPPAIKQSVIAELLVTLPPAPHVPVTDANNFRRLPPRDLLRHCPQYHFLYFHRPLHRGLRIRNNASHGLLSSPPEKRTYHVLTQPNISFTNDRSAKNPLTGSSRNDMVTHYAEPIGYIFGRSHLSSSRRSHTPRGSRLAAEGQPARGTNRRGVSSFPSRNFEAPSPAAPRALGARAS